MSARILILAALALIPPGAAVAEGLDKLPYTGFHVAYTQTHIDDLDIDASGPTLVGFVEVGANVVLTASYSTQETEDFMVGAFSGSIEGTSITLGIGYHYPLNPQIDLVPRFAVLHAKTEAKGWGAIPVDDDTGWTAGLGLRALLTPHFEVSGGATYVDIYDDNDTSYSAEAYFYPTKRFGIGAGYETADDSDAYSIAVRAVF